MEYPFWHLPYLGSTMIIPVIALPHILVSHFAVGGGILLYLGLLRARKEGGRADDFVAYLGGFLRFFVLLTVVFGAVTGVGIWLAISLASPSATSTLIHIFVFGWAAEWAFFVVELASALALYYYWDTFRPEGRLRVALVYAVSAWISLVLITGITAFMASSGSWPITRSFWDGFFNPTFLPSVLARTGGAVVISALYIFLHVSFVEVGEDLRKRVVRWTASWTVPGVILLAMGCLLWFAAAPENVQGKITDAPALLVIAAVSFGATLLLAFSLAVGPILKPENLNAPFAAVIFILGMTGLFSGEFMREATRKPFIIDNYLYSNSIRTRDIESIGRTGYLVRAPWPRRFIENNIEGLVDGRSIDQERIGTLEFEEWRTIGEAVFEYQCASCHTHHGYNALMPRIRRASPSTILHLVRSLDELGSAMPPFAGEAWEERALVTYLYSESREEE